MSQELVPARVSSPGRILTRELEARGWTQKDFAEIIGRPPQAISEIVRGIKQITPETALEFAEAFGTSPQFWMNLEANYRLFLAGEKKDDKEITRRSALYNLAPIAELLRLGWIRPANSPGELEREVCSFLEIPSPEQKPRLQASLRHGKSREPERNSLICWVKRVEHLAKEQKRISFDRARLERAIPTILGHAAETEDIREVPRLLRDLGVHFLIVPHLSGTYLDGGVSYIQNRPIVALSLRYDRIDSFWFTLMHELAHVVAGHRGVYLDNFDERDGNEKEAKADQIARDWLIETDAYERFVSQSGPYFSRTKIVQFAHQQRRHPGIVLGRLQNDGRVGYNNLRGLLERVRPYVQDQIDVPIEAS